MRKTVGIALSLVAGASVLAGCSSTMSGTMSKGPNAAAVAAPTSPGAAEQILASLPIGNKAPMTGYSRMQFGPAWTDNNNAPGGHNHCDTRDDILRRDLANPLPPTGCTVKSGTLHDVYTGKTIPFIRGPHSTFVQIDHMVPLGDAWQTGAQQLPMAQRIALANDPRNLQAVDGQANEQKGDADASAWLPPQQSYRCTYVERQVTIKQLYHLWVTQAEHDAIANLLRTC